MDYLFIFSVVKSLDQNHCSQGGMTFVNVRETGDSAGPIIKLAKRLRTPRLFFCHAFGYIIQLGEAHNFYTMIDRTPKSKRLCTSAVTSLFLELEAFPGTEAKLKRIAIV